MTKWARWMGVVCAVSAGSSFGASCGPGARESAGGEISSGDEDVMFPDEAVAHREAERAPPATETVQRGEELLAQGKPDEARRLFEQALEEDPRDIRAHLDLGLSFEMMGQPAEAEQAYRSALELDREFPEALNNLALVLRASGRLDEAVELLRRAVEARPDFPDAQLNLALALEEGGHLAAAADAYRKAVRVAPDDPLPRANLGLVLLELDQPEQAAIALREALPKARGNAPALQAIGNGLRRAGQSDAAVRAMRMAIEAHGQATPALLSELALAQRAAGDREGAEKTLERVLDQDPGYATGYYLLGSMRAGRGAFADAIPMFERYLDLAPDGAHAARARQHLEAARRAMR